MQECNFNKTDGGTTLHVVYAGNLRVEWASCCSRWYFTFNDQECTELRQSTVWCLLLWRTTFIVTVKLKVTVRTFHRVKSELVSTLSYAVVSNLRQMV